MEKVKRRFFLWLGVVGASLAIGLALDSLYHLTMPISLRLLGVLGMVLAVLILRTSGRMLREFGEPEEWGWTTRLVTHGIYSCVRHPHHFGIGLFITSLGLAVGGPLTFLLLSASIWTSIVLFLKRVEEPEAMEKFGRDYEEYRRGVRMIIPDPLCLLREVLHGSKGTGSDS